VPGWSNRTQEQELAGRLVLAVALAAALSLPGPSGAQAAPPSAAASSAQCPQPAADAAPIDRVSGADRYATAACASRAAFPTTTGGTALLASGDGDGGWADALAGTVLATALDAPVLLTPSQALSPATAAELVRLRPRRVILLGGQLAIGPAVARAVRAAVAGVVVERVAGSDRYATAAAVSARVGGGATAFVVNGFRPADALVAGAPAARRGARLLLTAPDGLPAPTRAALAGVTEIVIVGGYATVDEAVERELADLVGAGHLRRVSGGNRFATAASVARAFPAPGRILLAGGADASLVDAIGAAWSAARPAGGVVLYSGADSPSSGTDRYLRLGGLAGARPMRLFGGPAVLSPALVSALEARYVEAAAGGPPPVLLGLWAHLFSPALKSGPGIDTMLDAAAAGGLNTVVVQVARRQDAYYSSTVLPRTPDPDMPVDLDLLARLVPAAHDRGLAVHAWVPALPAHHGVYAGLRLPLWDAHGAGSADPWVSVDHAGAQGTFLDPGVPAVRDHVAAVFGELAGRYDVDAVHLDYLRYESRQWGYHPASLARFRAAHGLSSTYRPAPDDPRWGAWRRQMTTEVATAVRDAVRAADPGVAVTIAASTMGAPPRSAADLAGTRTWDDVFQPWPQWLTAGIVDAAMPMNYFRDNTHAAWFDGWVAFEETLERSCEAQRPPCVVAVGQAAYLNELPASVAQLRQALSSVDGAVVFSYQQDSISSPTGGLLGSLAGRLGVDPAPAPALR